jgi:pilus assembly protein CpaB
VLLAALALSLGALAAANVERREATIRRALGPDASVLVTRAPLAAGASLAQARPLLRAVPRRYVPPDPILDAGRLAGARVAVALPAGTYVTAAVLRPLAAVSRATVAPGERVADVVAHADPAAVTPGAHVDVLVTRDASGSRPGRTVLALQDVEVLAAASAPPASDAQGASGGSRVAASLRVSVREAVYLAAAQSFARDLRLLVRAPGDRARDPGVVFDDRLR